MIGDAFGALAHLGLARAHVVSGDAAKARGAVLSTAVEPAGNA
jgi:hypothetical protein